MEFVTVTVIAVASLVVAYFTYRAQVAPGFKRLHYTSVAFDLVLSIVHDDLRGLFKLYLKGEELINPVVCAACIQNTGRAPIRPDDFDAPLTIESAEKAAIFRGGIIECDPPNIFDIDRDRSDKAPFAVKMNKFMIRPVLLNPDDKFELAYIADMIPEKWDLSVSCRIVGLKQVVRVPRLADGLRQEIYAEPISMPGAVSPLEPGLERLSLFVWSAPILADIGGRFNDSLDLRVGNRVVQNPNLLYVIVSNEQKEVAAHNGSGIVSVDLPGARISRLVARRADYSKHERDGASYVSKVNNHKITVKIPELNPGDSVRVSAIISETCSKPIVEFENLAIDEAVLLQLKTGDDLIEKNLAKMDPKILLSNQPLYLSWQRLRERYEWHSRRK
jgi:hypothetical protein